MSFDLNHPSLRTHTPELMAALRTDSPIRANQVATAMFKKAARNGFLNGHTVQDILDAGSQFLETRQALQAATPQDGIESHPLVEVEQFLRRFVAYPTEHACVAHVLWIAHTHLMDAWDSTPRIAFLSPEPGSGKSRALEVSELLVPNPVEAVNVTPAYIFRKIGAEEGRPTILYDEIDTVFGPKAKENEEIRGLLNAGHRKHSVAGRCVVRGKQVFTEELPAYAAVALAGLGGLPDTILSRCVVVRMRRRAPAERIEPFRRRAEESTGTALRERLAAWAAQIAPEVTGAWPKMPDGVCDRDADVWEALLAVADTAGGEWPKRARLAAVAFVTESRQSTPSLGIRLLSDLRAAFGEQPAMSTAELISSLCAIEEAPWSDLRGKSITDRFLAGRLKEYEVKSKKIRIGEHTLRGYERADFHDAWERYLGPPHSESGTRGTSGTVSAESGVDVPLVPHVPYPMRDAPTDGVEVSL